MNLQRMIEGAGGGRRGAPIFLFFFDEWSIGSSISGRVVSPFSFPPDVCFFSLSLSLSSSLVHHHVSFGGKHCDTKFNTRLLFNEEACLHLSLSLSLSPPPLSQFPLPKTVYTCVPRPYTPVHKSCTDVGICYFFSLLFCSAPLIRKLVSIYFDRLDSGSAHYSFSNAAIYSHYLPFYVLSSQLCKRARK